jgi:DNA-binding phage protein
VNAQTVTEGVSKIAQETGLSSDDIQSALRSERIFDSFLTINKVDVNKLKSALGVSDLTKNQFIREMVKNA